MPMFSASPLINSISFSERIISITSSRSVSHRTLLFNTTVSALPLFPCHRIRVILMLLHVVAPFIERSLIKVLIAVFVSGFIRGNGAGGSLDASAGRSRLMPVLAAGSVSPLIAWHSLQQSGLAMIWNSSNPQALKESRDA